MRIGAFKALLALCGYPQKGPGAGGGFGNPAAVSVLAASGVPFVAPAATNGGVVATVAVPANTLKANGALRVYFRFTATNNANEKDISVNFGGTQIWASGLTSGTMYEGAIVIQNTGAVNAQHTTRNFASFTTGFQGSDTFNASAINTAVAQNLTINVYQADKTDVVTLDGYVVEVLNPAS